MAIAAAPPAGEIARGRGGFYRNAQDTPYVTDPDAKPVKSGKRKGEPKRIPYGSPSSRGKLIEDTWALNKYGERRIVMGIGVDLALVADCAAVARLDPETAEYRDAADRVVLRAKDAAKSALAAEQGSHTHALSEDHDEERDWIARAEAGENMGIPTDVQASLVQAWRDMLEREGLEILAVEASCVDDRWRLAGTLDRIARTTRDMRFALCTGEIVTVPAGTVLVLDIKSGKKRTRPDGSIMYWAGYSVQIASYAQSVPYDTVTETRGEWPWEISQQHALIAHLSVENALAGNPTCELVYVDLVAGREDGGDTVVRAKAWGQRRDVFSVAQLENEDGAASLGVDAPTGDGPQTPAEGEQLVRAPLSADSAGVEIVGEVPGDGMASTTGTSPTENAGDPHPAGDAGTEGTTGPPPPVVPSLTPAEQHAQIAARPDEGPTADPAAMTLLRQRYEQMPDPARAWFTERLREAMQHQVSFHLREQPSVRRFELARGLVHIAPHLPDDERMRAIVATIIHEPAWHEAITVGHLIGSLNHVQAAVFAERCCFEVEHLLPAEGVAA